MSLTKFYRNLEQFTVIKMFEKYNNIKTMMLKLLRIRQKVTPEKVNDLAK